METFFEKIVSIGKVTAHTSFSMRHAGVPGFCAALFSISTFYRASSAVIAPQLQRGLFLSPGAPGLAGFAGYEPSEGEVRRALDCCTAILKEEEEEPPRDASGAASISRSRPGV